VPFLEATAAMPEAVKRRVLRKMLTTAAIVAALLLILGGLLTKLLHVAGTRVIPGIFPITGTAQ
jgi:small neutral amino acid transporter SnatA (MarC family)